jgi:hypothetical protein
MPGGDSRRAIHSGSAQPLLECASYAEYVCTFHRVFSESGSRTGWKESYDISLAGAAASRVFATAGAGGSR